MTILHLVGPMVCGKSWVLNHFKTCPTLAIFDIMSFYERYGAIDIKTGQFNWDVWRDAIKELEGELTEFIEKNNEKVIAIESSGTNQTLNDILRKRDDVTFIYMKAPTPSEVLVRSASRGIDPKVVQTFNKKYYNRVGATSDDFTQEEAIDYIADSVNSNL